MTDEDIINRIDADSDFPDFLINRRCDMETFIPQKTANKYLEYLEYLGEVLGIIWANMDIQSHKGSWISKEMISTKQHIYGLEIRNKEYLYEIAKKKSEELWEEYIETEEYKRNEEKEE